MTEKMPSIEDFKDLAQFGAVLSKDMLGLFAERVIEFRQQRKDLEDLIPRSATISALLMLIGMIAKTDVLPEGAVHDIVNDAFRLNSMEEGKNEIKH